MSDQPGNPYNSQPGGGDPYGGNPSDGTYPPAGQNHAGNQNPSGGYPQAGQNPSGGYPQAGQYSGGQNPSGGYPQAGQYGYSNTYASGGYPQAGGPQGDQQWGAPQQMPAAAEAKGFFAALFDLSFQSFITIKFARFIYLFFIIVFTLMWFVGLISSISAIFAGDGGWLVFLAFLLFGWIPLVIYLVLVRLSLEFMIALVRTSQNTAGTRQEIEALRRDMRSNS